MPRSLKLEDCPRVVNLINSEQLPDDISAQLSTQGKLNIPGVSVVEICVSGDEELLEKLVRKSICKNVPIYTRRHIREPPTAPCTRKHKTGDTSRLIPNVGGGLKFESLWELSAHMISFLHASLDRVLNRPERFCLS